jgi:hypothetical protein
MYDLPEVSAATDAWWRGVASALRRAGLDAVPEVLTRDPDVDVWHSQNLLLSQTCGYPLTHELASVVELVATPDLFGQRLQRRRLLQLHRCFRR